LRGRVSRLEQTARGAEGEERGIIPIQTDLVLVVCGNLKRGKVKMRNAHYQLTIIKQVLLIFLIKYLD
jgi:hypothetical protein